MTNQDLVEDVARRVGRDDLVGEFQKAINRAQRRCADRHSFSEMLTRTTITHGAGMETVDLPTRFKELADTDAAIIATDGLGQVMKCDVASGQVGWARQSAAPLVFEVARHSGNPILRQLGPLLNGVVVTPSDDVALLVAYYEYPEDLAADDSTALLNRCYEAIVALASSLVFRNIQDPMFAAGLQEYEMEIAAAIRGDVGRITAGRKFRFGRS